MVFKDLEAKLTEASMIILSRQCVTMYVDADNTREVYEIRTGNKFISYSKIFDFDPTAITNANKDMRSKLIDMPNQQGKKSFYETVLAMLIAQNDTYANTRQLPARTTWITNE